MPRVWHANCGNRWGAHGTTSRRSARLPRPTSGQLAIDCRLDYRAGNLIRLARYLQRQPGTMAGRLEDLDYWRAKAELIKLPSVGRATADWICLFGLGRDEAVPIDVRTWNLARRMFAGEITTKTLTPRTYDRVVQLFQAKFGETAGWAQEYLYYGSRRGLFRRGRPVRHKEDPRSLARPGTVRTSRDLKCQHSLVCFAKTYAG